MQKIIVTGANGAGKSHLAAKLAEVRPEVPIISFDTIKLRTGWQHRSKPEIIASLDEKLGGKSWILEGGPSLLSHTIARADALIWLDPPEFIRAWRLAIRPWKFIGRTRPELPSGNVDWPVQQYKFAVRSLWNKSKFQSYIAEVYQSTSHLEKWRCRDKKSIDAIVRRWQESAA